MLIFIMLILFFLPFILTTIYILQNIIKENYIITNEFNYILNLHDVNNVMVLYDLRGRTFISMNTFFKKIIIVPYYCREILQINEVNALFLHEIGHIKGKHIEKSMLIWIICCFIQFFLTNLLFEINNIFAIIFFVAWFFSLKFIYDFLRKKYEKAANNYAAKYDYYSLLSAYSSLKKCKNNETNKVNFNLQ